MKSYDIKTCALEASKHFKNTWMGKWDWDYRDLRDAIQDAYKVEKIGKKKYEIQAASVPKDCDAANIVKGKVRQNCKSVADTLKPGSATHSFGVERPFDNIYVRKKGEKKIIAVYYWEFETLFIITGGEG